MNFSDAKGLVDNLLKGDASNASERVDVNTLTQAINDVSRRCYPSPLMSTWTGVETDVFRRIPSVEDPDTGEWIHRYIKRPDFTALDEDSEMPVDPELEMAVVYFLCSFFTTQDPARYVTAAEAVISAFKTNEIDPNDYSDQ